MTTHDVTPPSMSELPAQTMDAVTCADVGARAPQLASVNRQLLRLLVVEDNPADAELEVGMLEAAGYECRWGRVQTREEFLDRIEAAGYDLILADYALPTFDGLTALRLLGHRISTFRSSSFPAPSARRSPSRVSRQAPPTTY